MKLTSLSIVISQDRRDSDIYFGIARNFPYLCSTAQTLVARPDILYTPTGPMALGGSVRYHLTKR
jgi:hypothetical protein